MKSEQRFDLGFETDATSFLRYVSDTFKDCLYEVALERELCRLRPYLYNTGKQLEWRCECGWSMSVDTKNPRVPSVHVRHPATPTPHRRS
jgi:hypothetical protein